MNKFIFLVITASALLSYLIFLKKPPEIKDNLIVTSPSPSPFPTKTSPARHFLEVNLEDKIYLVYFFPLDGRKIEIIPNFTQKRSSKTIIEEAKCTSAVNGGFYTKEGTPLGLFTANGKIYSEEIKADTILLTGFFYLDEGGRPKISRKAPEKISNIIQAGPFIDNPSKFPTITDEEARRTVIAETAENLLYALSIVKKDDPYSGPLLSDLPLLLFSVEKPFRITKALNLDGGSASVYYGEDGFILSELTTVGSLLCVKPLSGTVLR